MVPSGSSTVHEKYSLEFSMIVPGSVPGSAWFRMVLEGENMDKLNTCRIFLGVPHDSVWFRAWFSLVPIGVGREKHGYVEHVLSGLH